MLAYHSAILPWQNLVGYKFFLVDQRAFACDLLKIFMEGGKIIEATFVAETLDALFIFNE